MSRRDGDPSKQPADCRNRQFNDPPCPNLKETGGGFEGERYECDVCGRRFFLDYEDMK